MSQGYVIGVDFGRDVSWGVLVESGTGEVLASSVTEYEQVGVGGRWPARGTLPKGFDMADPSGYIQALARNIGDLLQTSGIHASQVVALSLSFPHSTLLPVRQDGEPLCQLPKFRNNPHSWAKTKDHRVALEQVRHMNQIAAERNETWLHRCSGTLTADMFFPKLYQVLLEAPEVYEGADQIVEIGDWLVWRLTGNLARSAYAAALGALWSRRRGFPSDAYFCSVDPRLEHVVNEKMSRVLSQPGDKAGSLTSQAARDIGLLPGTAVAVANVTSVAAAVACGCVRSGELTIYLSEDGTLVAVADKFARPQGVRGVIEDSFTPGLYAYEAVQPAVGALFFWFAACFASGEAEGEKGTFESLVDIRAALQRLFGELTEREPGGSGLLALDWWAGSRSVPVDDRLSGVMLGYTLDTKPGEVFQALVESTGFGLRKIIQEFGAGGLPVAEITTCGPLNRYGAVISQVYADVLDRPIRSCRPDAAAHGAAIYGALAARVFSGLDDACSKMAKKKSQDTMHRPRAGARLVYSELYPLWERLHDLFGHQENALLKALSRISSPGL